MRAFLGLGSNLGHRRRQLRNAVAALPDVVAVSPVYETEPVGGPPGQGPYLNLVVELDTGLTARQLLELAHRLEDAAGLLDSVDKKTVANDVWQLMHDHLEHQRFAVVGHDWGAPVAFRLAADHADAVTHLAMRS